MAHVRCTAGDLQGTTSGRGSCRGHQRSGGRRRIGRGNPVRGSTPCRAGTQPEGVDRRAAATAPLDRRGRRPAREVQHRQGDRIGRTFQRPRRGNGSKGGRRGRDGGVGNTRWPWPTERTGEVVARRRAGCVLHHVGSTAQDEDRRCNHLPFVGDRRRRDRARLLGADIPGSIVVVAVLLLAVWLLYTGASAKAWWTSIIGAVALVVIASVVHRLIGGVQHVRHRLHRAATWLEEQPASGRGRSTRACSTVVRGDLGPLPVREIHRTRPRVARRADAGQPSATNEGVREVG